MHARFQRDGSHSQNERWLGWLALAWFGWLALAWRGWLALAWFGLGPMGPVPMGQGPGPGPWAQWARAQWARGPGRVGLAGWLWFGLAWAQWARAQWARGPGRALGPMGPFGPIWSHFGSIVVPYGPIWAQLAPN